MPIFDTVQGYLRIQKLLNGKGGTLRVSQSNSRGINEDYVGFEDGGENYLISVEKLSDLLVTLTGIMTTKASTYITTGAMGEVSDNTLGAALWSSPESSRAKVGGVETLNVIPGKEEQLVSRLNRLVGGDWRVAIGWETYIGVGSYYCKEKDTLWVLGVSDGLWVIDTYIQKEEERVRVITPTSIQNKVWRLQTLFSTEKFTITEEVVVGGPVDSSDDRHTS